MAVAPEASNASVLLAIGRQMQIRKQRLAGRSILQSATCGFFDLIMRSGGDENILDLLEITAPAALVMRIIEADTCARAA